MAMGVERPSIFGAAPPQQPQGELRAYEPSWRDRMAMALLGIGLPEQTVEGLLGSRGIGASGPAAGVGLADFTPLGVGFAVNEAQRSGRAGDTLGEAVGYAAAAIPPVAGPLRAGARAAQKGIRVFHGSSQPIERFKATPSYRQDELGRKYEVTSPSFFFTPDEATARMFAEDKVEIDKRLRNIVGSQPHVGEYELMIDNPLDLVEGSMTGAMPDYEGIDEIYRITGYQPTTRADVQEMLDDPHVVSQLRDEGYDGVRLLESNGGESWAVFDPEQIRAAKFGSTGQAEAKQKRNYLVDKPRHNP